MISQIFLMLLHCLITARAQTCTPLGCIQTYVLMNSSIPSTRDPPYACRGERVTYFCQVLNGASLQWASEPDICTSVPISYTSGDNEGELRLRGAYQSNLTSVVRNPPNSNFTSSLLLDTSGSMDSVTVVCGDQISSCISVQNQSVISITDSPMLNQQMLTVTTDMDLCPRPSIRVRFGELQSIVGLMYKLNISSSMGCALEECPMALSTEEKYLNFTLNGNDNYTVTLIVSNECGSDNISVTIQPEECDLGTIVPSPEPSPLGGPQPTSSSSGLLIAVIVVTVVATVIVVMLFITMTVFVLYVRSPFRKLHTQREKEVMAKLSSETKMKIQILSSSERVRPDSAEMVELRSCVVTDSEEVVERRSCKESRLVMKDDDKTTIRYSTKHYACSVSCQFALNDGILVLTVQSVGNNTPGSKNWPATV